MPKLTKLLRAYPDIKVEISTDYRMVDIVEMRFDAGVRLGESLAKDMIAVRIGPDVRMAVVCAPSYFARYPIPAAPHELTEHDCINVRLPTHGGLLPWNFKRGSQELNVWVESTLIFSGFPQVLKAALDGMGLTFILEEVAQKHIDTGRSSEFLMTGATFSRATICTTQADDSRRPPSRYWWMPCVTSREVCDCPLAAEPTSLLSPAYSLLRDTLLLGCPFALYSSVDPGSSSSSSQAGPAVLRSCP
ncbi:LysR substrate-binding domain-containing protein [Pseudoduganella umbonata]|nr:LysR substrate-binding domain-containing protein [Pseudoduganella umbonata]MBB3221652.1 DNA-binding transcriptional LysR family regulator [Pseudoduganella umbonata]